MATNVIRVGDPLAVRVEALDDAGELDAGRDDTITVSAVRTVDAPSVLFTELDVRGEQFEIANVSTGAVSLAGWTLTVHPARNYPLPSAIVELGPGGALAAGQTLVIGSPLALTTATNRLQAEEFFELGYLQANEPAAVVLRTGTGQVADVVVFGTALARELGPEVAALWRGATLNTIAQQPYQRLGGLRRGDRTEWVSGTRTWGALPAGVRIPFGTFPERLTLAGPGLQSGVWEGAVSLPAPGPGWRLHADDLAGTTGESELIEVRNLPALEVEWFGELALIEGGAGGTVRVKLPSPAASEVMVHWTSEPAGEFVHPMQVVIPAGALAAEADVAPADDGRLDGSQTVTLHAAAMGYATGRSPSVLVHDSRSASLGLELPAFGVVERGGSQEGRVTVDRLVEAPVQVNLQVAPLLLPNGSMAAVAKVFPETVFIPAGHTGTTFYVRAPENRWWTGPLELPVTALVPGWVTASNVLQVSDNDDMQIRLVAPQTLLEGTTGELEIRLGGAPMTNVVVRLSSDRPDLLAVPERVVFEASNLVASLRLPLTVPDNAGEDDLRTVTVNAAVELADGPLTTFTRIEIADDELHHFWLSGVPAAVADGGVIPLQVRAHALFGAAPVPDYAGHAELSVVTADGGPAAVQLNPSRIGPFVSGVWTGLVQVTGSALGVRLAARDGDLRGESQSTDILALRTLALKAADLVVSPDPLRLYAALAGTSNQPPRAVEIDPESGVISRAFVLPGDPHRLAVADDGQFLYAAVAHSNNLQRVRLADGVVDLGFSFGQEPTYGPYRAEALAVLPGQPEAVVISMTLGSGLANVGLACFDRDRPRPKTVGPREFAAGYGIALGGSSNAFLSSFPGGVRRIGVAEDGLTEVGVRYLGPDPVDPDRNAFLGLLPLAGGRFFGLDGHVLDEATFEPSRPFTATGRPAPDRDGRSGWFLSPGGYARVVECREPSGVPGLEFFLLDVPGVPWAFLRWGTHGGVVAGHDKLLLFRLPAPETARPADLALNARLDPPRPVVGGTSTVLLSVTNRGAFPAGGVALAVRWPAGLEIVGAPPGGWPDDPSPLRLGTLPPGAGRELAWQVAPHAAGAALVAANVTTASSESETSDNAAVLRVETLLPPDSGVRVLPLGATDLAAATDGTRLFATLSTALGAVSNEVVELDPATGAVLRRWPLGSRPGRLVTAKPATHLYAAYAGGSRISRVDLAAGTADLDFALPDGQHLLDMAVKPGTPDLLAVSTESQVLAYQRGVAGSRTGDFPGYVALPEGSVRGYAYGANLTSFAVSAAGVQNPLLVPHPGSINRPFALAYPLLYLTTGYVMDVRNSTSPIGYAEVFGGHSVVAEPERQRVYFLCSVEPQEALIRAYRMGFPVSRQEFRVRGLGASVDRLCRWGEDGFAFRTTAGAVVTLQAPLTGAAPAADLAVQVLAPPAAAPGAAVPVTVRVENLGPGGARDLSLFLNLPYGATTVSNLAASAGVPETGTDVWRLHVSEMAPGGVLTLSGLLQPGAQQPILGVVAGVAAASDDPVPVNNQAAALIRAGDATGQGLATTTHDVATAGGVLLASVSAVDGLLFEGLLEFEGATGGFRRALPLPGAPHLLAPSDDGRFVYVSDRSQSRIRRVDLAAGRVDLELDLPVANQVGDFVVAPGNPDLLLVARLGTDGSTPAHRGVTAFDRGVARPLSTQIPVFATRLAATGDGTNFFGFDTETSDHRLHRLVLTPDGLTRAQSWPGLFGDGVQDITWAGGRLYGDDGTVVDAVALTPLGRLPKGGRFLAADPARNRLVGTIETAWGTQVQAHDAATFAPVGSLDGGSDTRPMKLANGAGSVGLLRLEDGRLAIVPLGEPSRADLALSLAVTPPTGGYTNEFAVTVVVTNHGGIAVRDVRAELNFSGWLGVVALTNGTWSGGPQPMARLQFPEVGPLEEQRVEVRLRSDYGPGLAVFTGQVGAPVFDPNPTNNRAAAALVLRDRPTENLLWLGEGWLAADSRSNRLVAALISPGWALVSFQPELSAAPVVMPLPAQPTELTLADDGRTAYVALLSGTVARIDFVAGRLLQEFPLVTPADVEYGLYDFAVRPGAPETLAVARSWLWGQDGLTIYDNGVVRPQQGPGEGIPYFVRFADPDTLFTAGQDGLRRFRLTAAGVELEATAAVPPLNQPAFTTEAGKIFFHAGRIADAASLEVVAEISDCRLVAPHTTAGQVFVATAGTFQGFFGSTLLRGHSLANTQELWRVSVPGDTGWPRSLVRVNEDLALLTTRGFLSLHPLDSLTSPAADLTVLHVPPAVSNAGMPTAFVLEIWNRGPWPVSNAVVRITLPPAWELLAVEGLAGSVTTNGGALLLPVGALAAEQSRQLQLSVLPPAPGLTAAEVSVASELPDPAPEHNASLIALLVDPVPTVSLSNITTDESQQPTRSLSVPVQLSGRASVPVTIQARTVARTAEPGADYQPFEGSLTFPPGTTAGVLRITVIGDRIVEPDETFTVEIISTGEALPGRLRAEVTLRNDDAYQVLTRPVAVLEGDAGATNAIFLVSLTPPPVGPVDVRYAALGGSATAGEDFTAHHGWLRFLPGETNRTVALDIYGDTVPEPDESFFLELEGVAHPLAATNTFLATIQNDDVAAPARITGLTVTAGRVDLSVAADSGPPVWLERSTNLTAAGWQVIGNPVAISPTTTLSDLAPPAGEAFYRVRR